MVCQNWWPLVTGSIALKCGSFCQEYVVLHNKWSLMAVEVSEQISLYQIYLFLYQYIPFGC